MVKKELIERINKLKIENNAVIVAHNYQNDDIQEIADLLGDSYALSEYCAKVDAKTIVFCGVHFMAESAKILSPEKEVLLPEIDAGCPMADMVTADKLREKKKEHPDAVVVCYINSSAEVKAESDICCTSSNALNVVKSLEQNKILFVPDKNLGNYIAKQLPEKEIILWDGFCVTHNRVTVEDVKKVRKIKKNAVLLVHPECKPEVVEQADYVGSTKQIIDYAKNSKENEFIIGTEMGVLWKLKRDNKDKKFYLLSPSFVCPNMKKTTLESVYKSLTEKKYKIELSGEVIEKARLSLERMLKVKN